MASERIASYREFWPFYLSQHLDPRCRWLHVLGMGCAWALVGVGILRSPWCFAAAPVAGYFWAWIGHFVFEKNRPATLTYPLWSLRGDFQMVGMIALGKMDAELARLGMVSDSR